MGRTLLPYSMQIELVESRLKSFRRGLRKEEQLVFDGLIRDAKKDLQAGVMAASPDPLQSMLLSILLRQQCEMDRLNERLRRAEARIDR